MTARQYLSPIVRWWWLLLVAGLTTGVSTYFAIRPLPPVYVARATLLVGRGISDPNPSGNDLGLSQQLASAYAEIAGREPIQNATKAALGLGQLPAYVAQANDTFVDISVTSNEPRLAQAVANELANQLIVQSPTSQQIADQGRLEFTNQQLDETQAEITQTKADLAAKQNALAAMTSAVNIANGQNDITGLNAKLTTLETNYANLLADTQRGAANSLSLFAAATTPTVPIGPNKALILILAIASGLVLAACAAYLLEFLDSSLKTPEDITRWVPFPVIGHIVQMERVKGAGPYVARRPQSAVAESFRALWTNIGFTTADRPMSTLMVTSANLADGKTVVASNLSLTIARAGRKVILLDADMRRPAVHEMFHLSNSKGLSDSLSGSMNILSCINYSQDEPNLGVITAGQMPPDLTELVGSRKMDEILLQLREAADVVVIDTPPFLVADSWILAAKVQAVLIVVRPGHTRKESILALLDQVKRTGARVAGVTVNRIPRQPMGYYSAQMSPYYSPAKQKIQLPAVAARRATVKRTQASLELLNAISQFLASEADSGRVWQGILQLSVERMGASGGAVLVLDELGTVIDGTVAYNGSVHNSAARQLTETAEKGLAGWVIEHRQAAMVPNTLQDPRWWQRSSDGQQPASRSAISVPLIAARGVVGALTLTYDGTGYFSDEDLALLTAVSSCISLSGVPLVSPAAAGGNNHPDAASPLNE